MGGIGVNSNGPAVTKDDDGLHCDIENKRKEIKDENKVNEDVQEVDDGQTEGVQAEAITKSEQRIEGTWACWEELLSARSLKVMLVESDDETRNLVKDLLENCDYQVIAVDNEKQAWEILEDLTTHVDLVLSEVDMPSLAGIDLLTKIKNHKNCKNIPVIMMSDNDSMSIVLRCLSHGAADILVKPIRKNELKNLWQHVWRKCHNSSGTASESGLPTKISTESTSSEESDKNTGSNCEDNIGSFRLSDKNEGDIGSGTEITPTRPEAFGNDEVPAIETRECERRQEELDVVKGKGLGIGVPRIPSLLLEEPKEKGFTNMAGTNEDNEQLEKGQPGRYNEKPNRDLRTKAFTLMGVIITNSNDPQTQSEIQSGVPNHDNKEILSLELSLKIQTDDVPDTGFSDCDRNLLRHSNPSAFSRNKFLAASKEAAQSENLGRYSPLDNSSEAARVKSQPNFQSNSNSTRLYQCSNGSSSNNNMDSTTNNLVQMQHHDHHMYKVPHQQHEQITNHDDVPLKNLKVAAAPPKIGSSNLQGPPMEGIVGNHSRSGSGSGSNQSSNTHSGGSSAINSEGTNMEGGKVEVGEGDISPIRGGSKSAQRQAALNKFRQKRKERCFEKKVRYESRKKLAEKRPRVRGQFVRQVVHENKDNDEENETQGQG